MPYKDLAEHTNLIVAIVVGLLLMLGVALGVIGRLFWTLIKGIDSKQDEICRWFQAFFKDCFDHRESCKKELLTKLVTKEDFSEWKEGRKELWEAIHHHGHSPNGKVTRE